jgi:hypothetical protein
MITRRGFFGLLAAAVVVPKPTSVTIFFEPELPVSFANELLHKPMLDKALVDIAVRYHPRGYWVDEIFPITKLTEE